MRPMIIGALLAASVGVAGAESGIEQLAWLSGCWKAPSAETGSGEYWTPPAGGSMLGISRTIRRGTMVEFEFMQLRPLEDGTLAFIAQPFGTAPTTFRLKKLDSSGVTFENLEHDFPQRVIYSRMEDGNVSASIEGTRNGELRVVLFPLMRVDCTEQFRGAPE